MLFKIKMGLICESPPTSKTLGLALVRIQDCKLPKTKPKGALNKIISIS